MVRWSPLFLLFLAACDAGHLGNPVLLPVHGVATALENAAYGARRGKVSSHLASHRLGQPGVLFDLAGTPAANQAKVLREVSALAPDRSDWVEAATVIVMVHS